MKSDVAGNRTLRIGTILMVVLTILAYVGSLSNGFVGWDDPQLIIENATVRSFDWAGIATDFTQSNWHPLTLLSYAIEYSVVGLEPWLYHLTNLVLHLANCLFVVALVRKLLPERYVAALAAGFLFALHPLHVESVAWISERKDVLSTFFFLASALTYLRFADEGKEAGRRAFWVPYGLFLAALLSKSMAVTLPVVLVWVDVFRARRFRWSMVLSKWPWFLASFVVGYQNLAGQSTVEIVAAEPFRLPNAIGNSWRSLVFYVDKVLRPIDLSCYYEEDLLAVGVVEHAVFAVVVLGFGLYAWRAPRSRAPILLGLGMFLTTLALVLKLIPFGEQSLVNDRYLYIPSIGLFLAFGVVVEDVWDRANASGRIARSLALGTAIAAALGCALGTHARARVWRDDGTLWRDVIEKYPETPKAHEYLAFHYFDVGEHDLALQHMEEAGRLSPLSATIHLNLGALYGNLGRTEEARAAFERCVAADPDSASAHLNLGIACFQTGDPEGAERHLLRSLELQPGSGRALLFLGRNHARQGRRGEAEQCYREATRSEPWLPDPYREGIALLLQAGRRQEAKEWLDRADRAGARLPPELRGAIGE